jgi:hypothetical protein
MVPALLLQAAACWVLLQAAAALTAGWSQSTSGLEIHLQHVGSPAAHPLLLLLWLAAQSAVEAAAVAVCSWAYKGVGQQVVGSLQLLAAL